MKFVSYAQNYEDVILWRALKSVQNGFYVDIGANHPSIDSVTKAFYEKGWRGINIEPVSMWFELIQEGRPKDINLQVAVSNSTGTLNFFEVVSTGLSTTNFEFAKQHIEKRGYEVVNYEVPCRTLTDICRRHEVNDIHFLKIDIEGCEKEAIEGIDFSIIRPWILLIEATLPNTQIEDHEAWEHLVIGAGYDYVYFDGLNRFYVAREHSELKDAFKVPPNFWDDFITVKEQTFFQENQELQLKYAKLQLKYAKQDEAYARLNTNLEALKADFASLEANFHAVMNSRAMRLTRPLRTVIFHVRELKQSLYKLSAEVSAEKPRQYLRRVQLSIISIVLANPIIKKVAKKVATRFPFIMDYSRQLLTDPIARPRYSKNTKLSPLVSKVLLDLKASIKYTN